MISILALAVFRYKIAHYRRIPIFEPEMACRQKPQQAIVIFDVFRQIAPVYVELAIEPAAVNLIARQCLLPNVIP